MNDIPLSDIIEIKTPQEYKLHVARRHKKTQPLDVYVRDKKEWRKWNTWMSSRNDFSKKYVFSLIDFYPENNIWLFGGIYEVLSRKNIPKSYSYEIKELTAYSKFVGRLKIKLDKPSRGRAFLLNKFINKMMVSEILKKAYSGEVFPGYENINHDFSKLIPIFKDEKADWKYALKNIKGVYVIFDKSNGKKYVGSAYGESGIWSRWKSYMYSSHGGNDKLIELIKSKGDSYAEKNFKISLLEYRPMKTDDKDIIDRENYWKAVLLSIGNFGYNN